MTKDFSQVMSERTDKQLVEIVTLKRGEYQPEALFAAEEEIERRKINVKIFIEIDQLSEAVTCDEIKKGDLDFPWYYKVLTILLPASLLFVLVSLTKYLGEIPGLRILGFPLIVFIHYAIHKRVKDLGYTKMAAEFLKWINYAVFIYIGLAIVFGLTVRIFFMK